jgi:hypothetical protein
MTDPIDSGPRDNTEVDDIEPNDIHDAPTVKAEVTTDAAPTIVYDDNTAPAYGIDPGAIDYPEQPEYTWAGEAETVPFHRWHRPAGLFIGAAAIFMAVLIGVFVIRAVIVVTNRLAPAPTPTAAPVPTPIPTAAAPAPALPPPPAHKDLSPDDIFIRELIDAGMAITNRDSDISDAHTICEWLSQGRSDAWIMPKVLAVDPTLTDAEAHSFIKIARNNYCPR